MKVGNRNPYEIRLELLQLAQQICLSTHAARSEVVSGSSSAPTTEEIIIEAEKLNTFVSSNRD